MVEVNHVRFHITVTCADSYRFDGLLGVEEPFGLVQR